MGSICRWKLGTSVGADWEDAHEGEGHHSKSNHHNLPAILSAIVEGYRAVAAACTICKVGMVRGLVAWWFRGMHYFLRSLNGSRQTSTWNSTNKAPARSLQAKFSYMT